jgi:hypothetical protein
MNNVTAIYCISLDTSKDRQTAIRNQFPSSIEFFFAKRDTEDPRRGCYDSHSRVVKNAKLAGHKYILVLEDDAELLVPWQEVVDRTNECLLALSKKEWNYLMVGYHAMSSTKESSNMLKMQCAVGGHAYIANLEYTIEVPVYNGGHIDIEMFCNTIDINGLRVFAYGSTSGVYGVYPPLIGQAGTTSSTIGPLHTLWILFVNSIGDNNQALLSTYVHVLRFPLILISLLIIALFLFCIRRRIGSKSAVLIFILIVSQLVMLMAQVMQFRFVSNTPIFTASPLPDRGFDIIPHTINEGWIMDIILYFPLFVVLLILWSFKLGEKIRNAILINYILLTIARSITLSATAIPSPYHGGMEDGQYKNLIEHHKHDNDIGIVGHFDMMFSGHTGTVLTLLLWTLVLTERIQSIFWLSVVAMLVFGYAVALLAMRAHYSMDIMVGVIISLLLFAFCFRLK